MVHHGLSTTCMSVARCDMCGVTWWHLCMVVYHMMWHVWFHMMWHGCRWFNFGSALGHLAVAKGDWSRLISVVVQLGVV